MARFRELPRRTDRTPWGTADPSGRARRPLQVGKDAIARILDVVEEGAAGRDVVDRTSERVDVGTAVEVDGIEYLVGCDVAGGTGDESTACVGGDLHGAHHAEVDDDGR